MSEDRLQTIVSFSKRRGFIFPSSELYGGFAAVYDYGPYGALLSKNIKDYWWKSMVAMHENIVGLDSSIFMHPKIWEVSGHVGGFSDPLIECKACNVRSRADHLLEEKGVAADEKMSDKEINDLINEHRDALVCPACGKKELGEARSFNMLVKSNLGNFTGDASKDPVYLRGETAQGIFVNYKNVLDTTRVRIPFGIAQIGKSFRNEITARQFIFRKREFEQMEMQYFVAPEDAAAVFKEWKEKRLAYYKDLGIKEENLRVTPHENLVFYASAAEDIEYNFPFGFKELEGIHARGDYDLTQHMNASGVDLTYTDPKTGAAYVPHVVETATGVDRTVLAVLSEAYTEESLEDGKTRTVMKFPYHLAPVKVAVFPLLKNKEDLVKKAKTVFQKLSQDFMCEFDDNGNVGKRYRRQDEIGTPLCVTIDFDTLEDDTVTVRDRDTMQQDRVAISELAEYIREKIA